jgi:hypothetical protein
MEVPDDAPEACPVCERAYDSVSQHDAGITVNLMNNDRYRRVCFEPRPSERLWFFHHTHAQTVVRDANDATGRKTDADDAT